APRERHARVAPRRAREREEIEVRLHALGIELALVGRVHAAGRIDQERGGQREAARVVVQRGLHELEDLERLLAREPAREGPADLREPGARVLALLALGRAQREHLDAGVRERLPRLRETLERAPR